MKVFDLQCEHAHVFEGWFASHEDYDAQQARGLVTCPVCNSGDISRRVSAPHLNVAHLHASASAPAHAPNGKAVEAGGTRQAQAVAQLQAAMLQKIREFVRNTEDVGPRFAEEARAIHQGDAQERAIRGTSTPDERRELAEEGIDVVALPDIFNDERLQ
jgi:hypothetical protein